MRKHLLTEALQRGFGELQIGLAKFHEAANMLDTQFGIPRHLIDTLGRLTDNEVLRHHILGR